MTETVSRFAAAQEAGSITGLLNDRVMDYWSLFQMSTMARILLSWVPMVDMISRNDISFDTVGSFGSGSCTHETTLAMMWPEVQFHAYDETDRYVPKRTTDAWEQLPNMQFTVFDFSSAVDGSFDFVFSIQTLEHILDMESALADLVAATAPAGCLYIDTPLYHEEDDRQADLPRRLEVAWERHSHHHLGFSRLKMIERLERHGLEILDSGYYCYMAGDQAALNYVRTTTGETREMVNERTGTELVRLYERLLRGSETAYRDRFDEIDGSALERRPCAAIRVLARRPT